MPAQNPSIRGRGAAANPPNRFEKIAIDRDEEWGEDDPAPKTEFFKDHSRSAIAYNDSPDIPFTASLNPYRGCEHGCVYCYARPTHEYLGFSAGLDFESRILVKSEAPELLREELASARWKPQVIAMSGVTDCYQPVERKLELTRRCLKVLAEFRNPVAIVTKSRLVTRDIDVLSGLARDQAAAVYVSVTTLDGELARILEPRAAQPRERLSAIRELAAAGVPVGVMAAPIIPAINDHEIPKILGAAAEAGARFAGYTLVRLPHGVAPLFEDWLKRHFPQRKEKVLNQLRALRGGRLLTARGGGTSSPDGSVGRVNDPRFGSRMRGQGAFARHLAALFVASCRRAGLDRPGPELSSAAFRPPGSGQLSLF